MEKELFIEQYFLVYLSCISLRYHSFVGAGRTSF